jgi:hypothetical protein
MNIPGLGSVTKDEQWGWYCSEPIPVSMFGGKPCRMVLKGYEQDSNKNEFHVAIANFLSATPAVLSAVKPDLYQYYKDFEEFWVEDGNPPIESARDIWQHIHLGNWAIVQRRHYGDRGIYILVESECDWEDEHGLQIVFKNGQKVNKLGPYDGHLTNSDAYDRESLENVVYQSWRS